MMISLVTREGKGDELTWEEVDGNWAAIQSALNALGPTGPDQYLDFRAYSAEGRYLMVPDLCRFAGRVRVQGASESNFSDQGLTNTGGVYLPVANRLIGTETQTFAVKFKTTQTSAGSDFFWWKPTIVGVAIASPDGYETALSISSGNLRCWGSTWFSSTGAAEGDCTIHTSQFVADGAWHTAAVVWDSNVATLYLDGLAVGSKTNTGPNITTFGLSGYPPFLFRCNGTQFTSDTECEFFGTIQKFAAWSRALTAAEVSALGW